MAGIALHSDGEAELAAHATAAYSLAGYGKCGRGALPQSSEAVAPAYRYKIQPIA